MSSHLDIFREINTLAARYYTEWQSDHINFLSACHRALGNYFSSYFKETFIFSALSYSKKDHLHFVDEQLNHGYVFNQKNVSNWQDLRDTLGEYILEVSSMKMISITKILLDKSNTTICKDLFFNCCSGIKYPVDILGSSIFEYTLENFSDDDQTYYRSNRLQLDNFRNTFSNKGVSSLGSPLYDRYVWNHHRLAQCYRSASNKDFLLHYIKPSIRQLNYGLLLSLAMNRQLTSDEVAFINLILYRIVSQMASERMKEDLIRDKEIEDLKNVSASSHVIKTTVNGLFGPPLNSLLQESTVDPRIVELQTAKEKILDYAEVTNLVTKLSSDKIEKNEIQDALASSSLFTLQADDLPEIDELLKSIKEGRNNDPNSVDLSFEIEMIDGGLAKEVFKYGKYHLSRSFYELLLLTIIENVIKHGATNRAGELTVSMYVSKDQILFINKPKPNSKQDLEVEDMTDNFRVFHTVFSKLNLGVFVVTNDGKEFKVLLKANENG